MKHKRSGKAVFYPPVLPYGTKNGNFMGEGSREHRGYQHHRSKSACFGVLHTDDKKEPCFLLSISASGL